MSRDMESKFAKGQLESSAFSSKTADGHCLPDPGSGKALIPAPLD